MRRIDPDAERLPLEPSELPASAAIVVEALRDLVTPRRLARLRSVAERRIEEVALVLESIDDPHNASAALRSADAFGLSRVDVIPGPGGFLASRAVSKGTHRWLDLHPHRDAASCAASLRAAGYRILVASMEGSVRPEQLPSIERLALVFGNEHRGPSEGMRALADGTYAIPMVGFVESLNISVAAAISLYAATRNRPPPSSEASTRCLARYLLASVREGEARVREYLASRGA